MVTVHKITTFFYDKHHAPLILKMLHHKDVPM